MAKALVSKYLVNNSLNKIFILVTEIFFWISKMCWRASSKFSTVKLMCGKSTSSMIAIRNKEAIF